MSTGVQTLKQTAKILVAEDCRDTQFILEYTLKNIGAEIHFVGNGADCVVEALSAANTEDPFDLILMDIQMPVLDGYEATKKLRSQGYGQRIVALTTRSTKSDQEASIAAGCDGHMSKLMKKNQLISGVEEWLRPEVKGVQERTQLPALPVLPEIIETEPSYAGKVLNLINDLPKQRECLIVAGQHAEWAEVKRIALELTTVSLFGYRSFSQSLEALQEALNAEQSNEMQQSLKQLIHCVDGILAGRKKLSEVAARA